MGGWLCASSSHSASSSSRPRSSPTPAAAPEASSRRPCSSAAWRGAFALVGMGAVFAGIIRAPITSVLIIIEMTDGYALIVPLMIANMLAYGIARQLRPTPIYEALLEQDGIRLHEETVAEHLGRITVADVPLDTGTYTAFQPETPLAELLQGL